MTIHLDRLPAEGLELRADVIETGYVTNVAVNLQVVVVDDGNEIVKMVVGGEHGRFPDLPLLDFAVAEQREDAALGAAVALLVNAHAERDARGNREPLAKRSGRDLDTGKLLGIGVTLQTAVQLAQREQFVFGNIAELGERGVEHGRRMALRENEVIAFGMLRIGFGIVHHAAKIERGDDVRGGK